VLLECAGRLEEVSKQYNKLWSEFPIGTMARTIAGAKVVTLADLAAEFRARAEKETP